MINDIVYYFFCIVVGLVGSSSYAMWKIFSHTFM